MQQLPKGVIYNPKRANRPYSVMIDDVWFYHETLQQAVNRLERKARGNYNVTQESKRKYRMGEPYNGWETRRTICSICKDSIGIGRIAAHEEACKRRAAGIKYVRPDRRVRKRETERGTHFDSHKIFMEYQGEERSLNEIAKMTGTPLDTLRHRYRRKRMANNIEYLFGPVVPAERYTTRLYKKKEDDNHAKN